MRDESSWPNEPTREGGEPPITLLPVQQTSCPPSAPAPVPDRSGGEARQRGDPIDEVKTTAKNPKLGNSS